MIEERDHIPNTFETLVDWLNMTDWDNAAAYALDRSVRMNGGRAVEAAPVPRRQHHLVGDEVRALKREYDRVLLI